MSKYHGTLLSWAVGAAVLMATTVADVAEAQGKKPGAKTIAEIAVEANTDLGEFDFLLAAVACLTDEASGTNAILEALGGRRPLTLFAPTDAAFEKLLQTDPDGPKPSPSDVCELGDTALANVLQYHVTQGRRFSNRVFAKNKSRTLTMLNGGTLTTNPDGTLTDATGQTVGLVMPSALADISARNGVVHVIDRVLLPGS